MAGVEVGKGGLIYPDGHQESADQIALRLAAQSAEALKIALPTPNRIPVPGTLNIISQSPEYTSQADADELIFKAIANLQKVERNYMGRDEVTVGMETDEPIMMVMLADLHIGSLATDHNAVIAARDFILKNPNARVVLLGDELEGLVEKYMNTNMARTVIDFHKQIDFLRDFFLKPLADEGRILGMVSGYWGHNGWAEDATTLNTWIMLSEGFRIPIIKNGGILRIQFPGGYEYSESIWHNPPAKSALDPVKGLRDAAFHTSESNRTTGYASAHTHRMGVSKELFAGAESAVNMISTGTAKGSSDEVPFDRFGGKLGFPKTDHLGQGIMIAPPKEGHGDRTYPFASFDHGQVANDALRLLDSVESQGMTVELLEKIRAEVEARPKVKMIAGRSRLSGPEHAEDVPQDAFWSRGEKVVNPYSGMVMRAPFTSLRYDVETRLPIALHLLSNARFGSSSEGYNRVRTYIETNVLPDPHSLVVFLRNMIDSEAGKSPERMNILNRLRDVIKMTGREQTLAIMMDQCLRTSDWKKRIKTSDTYVEEEPNGNGGKRKMIREVEYSMPLAPGSYLANETNVPLIHHLSIIKLTVGPKGVKQSDKPLYIGQYADHLLHSGSFSKPTFGLSRMYGMYAQEKPSYMAGGHMPNAGAMTFYDGSNPYNQNPVLVAPGWFAEYADSMGKGNVMPGAEPGQALIFIPGTERKSQQIFPTVSADETRYMQDALTLMKGLEILGLTEAVLCRTYSR